MHINRLRPPPGCTDLELWLSGVVNDAVRDATEAGLPEAHAVQLLRKLADMWDPEAWRKRFTAPRSGA